MEETKQIKYSEGYLYKIEEELVFQTNVKPKYNIGTRFLTLYRDGVFVVHYGYAFDGPSGPTKWITECLGKFSRPGRWLKAPWSAA